MRLRAQTGFVLLIIFSGAALQGQNAPASQPSHARLQQKNAAGTKPTAGIPQQATPAPAIPQNTSLLDQPAKPAQVQLSGGKLSVKADNSGLADILHNISAKTGMTVDGLSRDPRIFGNYGPAAPREVLSALLDGLGYNVMMVGALDNGAPRQLTLTPRTGGVSTGPNRQMPAATQTNNDDDDSNQEQDEQDNQMPPRPEPVPPETVQPPEPVPPENPAQPQVKTPQQMLQELQQMRQQQLQQQQQANPQ